MSSKIRNVCYGVAAATAAGYATNYYYTKMKPAYCPTPKSLMVNLYPLVKASVSGLVGTRYEEPESYKLEKRAELADGPDHVHNVNQTLDERGIAISGDEALLIKMQYELGIEPGSPLDSAFEEYISQAFYESYQRNLREGEALADIADEYQLAEIRLNASNNLLGSHLHSKFDSLKSKAVCISDTLHLEDEAVVEYCVEYHREKDKAKARISDALEYSSTEGDFKKQCVLFKQRFQSHKETEVEYDNDNTVRDRPGFI